MPKRSFFVLCIAFFALSFGVAAMAAMVPAIAAHFDASLNQTVKLTWLYMLPYGVVALIWAPLSRAVTIKKLFLIGSLGFCLSAIFFSTARTLTLAYVFRFLMGCFGCGFVPLSLIVVGKSVANKKKAKYLGTLFGISYLSTFISVSLSAVLSWRALYFVPAVLGAIVFALLVFNFDEHDYRNTRAKISYGATFKDKAALRLFAVIMVSSFLYHSIQQRLGVYFSQHFSLSQVVISGIFTVAIFCSVISEFGGGLIAGRWGSINVARLGFFLMGVFAVLLLLIGRHELFFITIGLWGIGWALSHVGLATYLTQLPDSVMRDASSLNSALRFLFGGLGAVFGGILAKDIGGYKALFCLVGLSVFIVGFFIKKWLQLETKENYG